MLFTRNTNDDIIFTYLYDQAAGEVIGAAVFFVALVLCDWEFTIAQRFSNGNERKRDSESNAG